MSNPVKRRRQANRIDLAKIDVADFLELLGIRNISDRGGREITFSCPFPAHAFGDIHPSASMNRETTAWQCWSCSAKGANAVSFVAKLLEIPYSTAARFIREKYGGEVIDPDQFSMVDEIKRRWIMRSSKDNNREEENIVLFYYIPKDRTSYSKLLSYFHFNDIRLHSDAFEYMINRGFSEKTMLDWMIGFDPRSNRIIIPVFDENDRLVGFRGRIVGDNKTRFRPKYFLLGDSPQDKSYGFPRFHKSLVCFGINRAKKFLSNHPVIIVEGEFDCMALHQHGFPWSVGIFGSQFSNRQSEIIRRYASEAIIFLDWDHAGMNAAIEAEEKLRPFMPVKYVGRHEGDPASMSREEICEAIDGACSTLALRMLNSS